MSRSQATLGVLLPPLLYFAVISWVSHQPVWTSGPPPFPHFDKLFHCIEFVPLGVLLFRAERSNDTLRWGRTGLFSVLVGVSLGCVDELHQSFVDGRHADVWDAVADGVGVVLGVIVWRWALARRSLSHDLSSSASGPDA